MFVANADDVLDDEIMNLLKEKKPFWTESDYHKAADLLKQFRSRVLDVARQSLQGEINAIESQQKVRNEFEQWRIQVEAFVNRRD